MERRCFVAGLFSMAVGCTRGDSTVLRSFDIGAASSFAPGDTPLPLARLLVRRNARSLRAMSLVCTHQGCVVASAESGFRCPCHGATYDERGVVTSGPAPRPLPYWRLSVEQGTLRVHVGDEVGPEWALELPV